MVNQGGTAGSDPSLWGRVFVLREVRGFGLILTKGVSLCQKTNLLGKRKTFQLGT